MRAALMITTRNGNNGDSGGLFPEEFKVVSVFIANPLLKERGRLLVPLLLKEVEGHKGGELVMYLKLWNVLAEILTPRPLDS